MDERRVRLVLDGDMVVAVKPALKPEPEKKEIKDQQSSFQDRSRKT
jgi:hypothetical protein